MPGNERKNKNVLRRCLKTASDGAAVTWAGRSFHTATPETVNEWLPIVDRRMIGTCRRSELDERSRRRDGMSATRVKYCDEYAVCLSVCLCAGVSQQSHDRTSPIPVHVTCGRGSVSLSPIALWYVMYFRFCGWRHVFTQLTPWRVIPRPIPKRR